MYFYAERSKIIPYNLILNPNEPLRVQTNGQPALIVPKQLLVSLMRLKTQSKATKSLPYCIIEMAVGITLWDTRELELFKISVR